MKFGLFYEWPNPTTKDWKQLFEQGMEQIQYSEEMGYDFVLIAEHHFSNYGNSPAPLLQAMYIAQHTKRIKIATGILVLPIWQPLRLAEEVAVLDNLSDGRFICGVGRGYQPHEFNRFGITSEESRGRFLETLDVLELAWTSDTSFTYDGQYVKITEETVVWPKPLQKPHPPLWLAGTSADSIKLAAERDMTLITTAFQGAQGMLNTVAVWVQERAALGKTTNNFDMGIQALTLVTDTDEEARASMNHTRWQLRANRSLNRPDVVDGRVNPTPFDGEVSDEQLWEVLFYGTPDRIRGKLEEASSVGVTMVSNWMMLGDMEHDKVMKSIRLMGEEVIPAVKDLEPPAELYEELTARVVESDSFESQGPVPS